jgi:hypothetical protein
MSGLEVEGDKAVPVSNQNDNIKRNLIRALMPTTSLMLESAEKMIIPSVFTLFQGPGRDGSPFPEDIIKKVSEGDKAFKKGDYKKAEACYREILPYYRFRASDFALGEVQLHLARSMSKQGKYAVPEFDEALKIEKDAKMPYKPLEAFILCEKAENLLTCKDKKQDARLAEKTCTAGIELLKGVKARELANTTLLANLYATRALANLKLEDITQATQDLTMSISLRKK